MEKAEFNITDEKLKEYGEHFLKWGEQMKLTDTERAQVEAAAREHANILEPVSANSRIAVSEYDSFQAGAEMMAGLRLKQFTEYAERACEDIQTEKQRAERAEAELAKCAKQFDELETTALNMEGRFRLAEEALRFIANGCLVPDNKRLEEIEYFVGLVKDPTMIELIAAVRERDTRIASLEAAKRKLRDAMLRLSVRVVEVKTLEGCAEIITEALDAGPTGGTR